MSEQTQPTISICCITYNHEKYIKDAIDGFLMQETNFPVEIVIGEDKSTDGTANILLEYQNKYPGRIRLFNRENNLGMMANYSQSISDCKGKYIALCEGDDYWTDPLKLQKQVDFLESHPGCSICCHKVSRKTEGSADEPYLWPKFSGNQIFKKERFYGKYLLQTCAVVFRNNNLEELVRFLNGFKVGDYPLFYFLAQQGDIGYLDNVMAVYRIHEKGVSSGLEYGNRLEDFYNTLAKIKESLSINSKNYNHEMFAQLLRIIEYYSNKHNVEKTRFYLKKAYETHYAATIDQLLRAIIFSYDFLLKKNKYKI